MNAAMFDAFAPAHGTGMLFVSILFTLAAFVSLAVAQWWVAPTRPEPADAQGPLRRESPAVVNVLTNDATLTAAGLRATVIDLAARGWLRLLPPETDDELGRVRPAATARGGDALLPHERLVLQHVLARFTSDEAIPAQYLAVDVRGTWWRRFRGLVDDEARRSGLVRRRWQWRYLVLPVLLTVLGLMSWFAARDDGAEGVAVVDSLERRSIALVVLVALAVMVVRILRRLVSGQLTHTMAGLAATQRWLVVRQRLVDAGFAQMAPSSIDTGDRRLAYASAMCVAEGAAVELPLAREDHYRAWSAVGGRGRLIRIRYPWRPAYGLHPVVALVGGVAAAVVGVRLKDWFSDAARGETWGSLYDRFPDQDWLIADIATGLAAASLVPIVLGVWMAIAGAIDLFSSTERTGIVVRARRPAEVSPLPRFLRRLLERDRYSVYLVVDDGTQSDIWAWRSNERHAVPQGARAVVRATPMLGYVRSSTPVGHVLAE